LESARAAPQAGSLIHVNPLLKISCREAGHYDTCRQAGEEAPPGPGDSRDRTWSTGRQPQCGSVSPGTWTESGRTSILSPGL